MNTFASIVPLDGAQLSNLRQNTGIKFDRAEVITDRHGSTTILAYIGKQTADLPLAAVL